MFDRMPKILGVTMPCPFSEKLFVRPLAFPKTKLRTDFEVSSSDSFDRIPRTLGGQDAPFVENNAPA